jgi:hypothetical protein
VLPPEQDDPAGEAEPVLNTADIEVGAVYSCQTHAGELAFAAAYTVTAGPTGAV